jgi:cell division protein FtsL
MLFVKQELHSNTKQPPQMILKECALALSILEMVLITTYVVDTPLLDVTLLQLMQHILDALLLL